MNERVVMDRWINLLGWMQVHQWHLGIILGAGFDLAFGPNGNRVLLLALNAMIIDIATGLLKGGFWQCLCREISWEGLKRKTGAIILVYIGHLLDSALGTGDSVKGALSWCLFSHESVSAVQNLVAAGVVVPQFLLSALQKLVERSDEDTGRAIMASSKMKTEGTADNAG